MYRLYTTSQDRYIPYLLEDLSREVAVFCSILNLTETFANFHGWPSKFMTPDHYTSVICEFSSFEELRQNYPELFI